MTDIEESFQFKVTTINNAASYLADAYTCLELASRAKARSGQVTVEKAMEKVREAIQEVAHFQNQFDTSLENLRRHK